MREATPFQEGDPFLFRKVISHFLFRREATPFQEGDPFLFRKVISHFLFRREATPFQEGDPFLLRKVFFHSFSGGCLVHFSHPLYATPPPTPQRVILGSNNWTIITWKRNRNFQVLITFTVMMDYRVGK